jgi:hypothetical protein
MKYLKLKKWHKAVHLYNDYYRPQCRGRIGRGPLYWSGKSGVRLTKRMIAPIHELCQKCFPYGKWKGDKW